MGTPLARRPTRLSCFRLSLPLRGSKEACSRLTQTIEVNGDDFAANASNQFFDTNGVQYDTGCATVVAHRIE
jgi:hypothetical protein